MTRRWYETDYVRVAELEPGAEMVGRRRVESILRTEAQAIVRFDDGTSETFDLAGDPAVEIVTAGLK